MIPIETLMESETSLARVEIEHWVAEGWVRPEGSPGAWLFGEIDIARVRLIRTLRHEYRLEEDALPVILRLLDQLYDSRRDLHRLRRAIARTAPEIQSALRAALADENEA